MSENTIPENVINPNEALETNEGSCKPLDYHHWPAWDGVGWFNHSINTKDCIEHVHAHESTLTSQELKDTTSPLHHANKAAHPEGHTASEVTCHCCGHLSQHNASTKEQDCSHACMDIAKDRECPNTSSYGDIEDGRHVLGHINQRIEHKKRSSLSGTTPLPYSASEHGNCDVCSAKANRGGCSS